MEWLSAQNYIENLPECELQQEEAWGRFEQEYSTGVEEINARTLDNRNVLRMKPRRKRNGMISGKRRISRFITDS